MSWDKNGLDLNNSGIVNCEKQTNSKMNIKPFAPIPHRIHRTILTLPPIPTFTNPLIH